MSVSVVAHPKARRSPCWQEFLSHLEGQGVHPRVEVSGQAGHARELAAALAASTEILVAAGGDGTVHEVANGLLEAFPPGSDRRPPPLLIVPLGTGNDFARALGLPRQPGALARMLLSPRPRPLDVGRLTCQHQGRPRQLYFVASCSVGFAAEATRRALQMPGWLPARAIYLLGLASALVAWKSHPARLRIDGQPRESSRFFNLNAANTRYYGNGMVAAPRAVPDDQALEVVLMELSLLQVLLALPENYRGRFERVRGVWQTPARRVEVEADPPLPVQADGEMAGTTPLSCEVVPAALEVLHPQGRTGGYAEL